MHQVNKKRISLLPILELFYLTFNFSPVIGIPVTIQEPVKGRKRTLLDQSYLLVKFPIYIFLFHQELYSYLQNLSEAELELVSSFCESFIKLDLQTNLCCWEVGLSRSRPKFYICMI